MQKLDALASHPWYIDHLRPVWEALPPERRGTFHVGPAVKAPGFEVSREPLRTGRDPILVAATGDMFVAAQHERRIAMMEHGAGQSYGGSNLSRRHSSYAGGDHRVADLYLHPGPHPAWRDRKRYPDAQVEIIGCPRLDSLPTRIPDGKTTVAISFHWDCMVAPETRSAFIQFRSGVEALALQKEFTLLGHGHPRILDRLRPWYARKGIEVVESLDEVFRRADVYVCDNSSSIFEFAHTDRPVVLMNPPYYRKTVEHGLRFWAAADVGLQVSEPSELGRTIRTALRNTPDQQVAREAALSLVYTYRTGAAQRAAEILVPWMDR